MADLKMAGVKSQQTENIENIQSVQNNTENEYIENIQNNTELTAQRILAMKVDDLKQELESRSLSKTGVKLELQKRLANTLGLELQETSSSSLTTIPQGLIPPTTKADNDGNFMSEFEELKRFVMDELFKLKETVQNNFLVQNNNTQQQSSSRHEQSYESTKIRDILETRIECLQHEITYLIKENTTKQSVIEMLINNNNQR